MQPNEEGIVEDNSQDKNLITYVLKASALVFIILLAVSFGFNYREAPVQDAFTTVTQSKQKIESLCKQLETERKTFTQARLELYKNKLSYPDYQMVCTSPSGTGAIQ